MTWPRRRPRWPTGSPCWPVQTSPRKRSGCWPPARGSPPTWPRCPRSARPRDIPDGWEQLAATFTEKAGLIVTEHGAGQPDLAAFGALVAAERRAPARPRYPRRPGVRWPRHGGQRAGRTGRRTPGCARRAPRSGQAGANRPAGPWLHARTWPGELQAAPLLTRAAELARRARLAPAAAQPARSAKARPGSTSPTGRRKYLAHLVQGDSNRQIARALFISERTVAVHVSRILDKLGVRNRTEAATAGARLGLSASLPRQPD